jgi:VWFA-related protein
MKPLRLLTAVLVALTATSLTAQQQPQSQPPQTQQQPQQQGDQFRFRTGVDLINVTATVTDENGRFVSGLKKEDFRVYQDEQLQTVTHFDSERVPVSLGIVLDTSGSMDGEKMAAARRALDRFLFELLGRDDEVFLYTFSSHPQLVEGWTRDFRRISDALSRVRADGGTAMYDAVAEAIPLAQSGHNRKKALVIISDGNDTSSHVDVLSLRRIIRESEVLVYAIGIDHQTTTGSRPWGGIFSPLMQVAAQRPRPLPFPMPGRRTPPANPPGGTNYPRYPPPPRVPPGGNGSPTTRGYGASDRVNVAALRDLTDDSGGRTEIIRYPSDLDPATAGIADELSRQYFLGYPFVGQKDGQWHTLRVEVGRYLVRARRGFAATP